MNILQSNKKIANSVVCWWTPKRIQNLNSCLKTCWHRLNYFLLCVRNIHLHSILCPRIKGICALLNCLLNQQRPLTRLFFYFCAFIWRDKSQSNICAEYSCWYGQALNQPKPVCWFKKVSQATQTGVVDLPDWPSWCLVGWPWLSNSTKHHTKSNLFPCILYIGTYRKVFYWQKVTPSDAALKSPFCIFGYEKHVRTSESLHTICQSDQKFALKTNFMVFCFIFIGVWQLESLLTTEQFWVEKVEIISHFVYHRNRIQI